MDERLILGENQEPLVVSPVYLARTTTTLGNLQLDYMNSRLRHFPGNPDMNHLEYTDAEGGLHGIFFSQMDEAAPEELAALGFPATVDPIPSKSDISWYDRAVMDRLNVAVTEAPSETALVPVSNPNNDTGTLIAMGAAALAVAFVADKLLGDSNKHRRS